MSLNTLQNSRVKHIAGKGALPSVLDEGSIYYCIDSGSIYLDTENSVNGYYNTSEGKFYAHYENNTYSNEITGEEGSIYVDLSTGNRYTYQESNTVYQSTDSGRTRMDDSLPFGTVPSRSGEDTDTAYVELSCPVRLHSGLTICLYGSRVPGELVITNSSAPTIPNNVYYNGSMVPQGTGLELPRTSVTIYTFYQLSDLTGYWYASSTIREGLVITGTRSDDMTTITLSSSGSNETFSLLYNLYNSGKRSKIVVNTTSGSVDNMLFSLIRCSMNQVNSAITATFCATRVDPQTGIREVNLATFSNMSYSGHLNNAQGALQQFYYYPSVEGSVSVSYNESNGTFTLNSIDDTYKDSVKHIFANDGVNVQDSSINCEFNGFKGNIIKSDNSEIVYQLDLGGETAYASVKRSPGYVNGYFHNGFFFVDSEYKTLIIPDTTKYYYDLSTDKWYSYSTLPGSTPPGPQYNEWTSGNPVAPSDSKLTSLLFYYEVIESDVSVHYDVYLYYTWSDYKITAEFSFTEDATSQSITPTAVKGLQYKDITSSSLQLSAAEREALVNAIRTKILNAITRNDYDLDMISGPSNADNLSMRILLVPDRGQSEHNDSYVLNLSYIYRTKSGMMYAPNAVDFISDTFTNGNKKSKIKLHVDLDLNNSYEIAFSIALIDEVTENYVSTAIDSAIQSAIGNAIGGSY